MLSPHFHLHEFERSSTAAANHICNAAPLSVITNLQVLCQEVLEPLRQHFFDDLPPKQGESKGVFITSGYRCRQLNTLVGGATTSQHMTGEACDIRIPDLATGKRWFQWMSANLHFDQLIWEHNKSGTYWIHVSYKRTGNRQQVIHNLLKC